MKKLITIALLIVFTMTLSGCRSDLEKAFRTMDKVDSYRMDMTMNNIPMFGSMTFTMKVDDDLMYSSDPLGGTGTYSKTVDGEEYEYILQPDGSYELSDTPVETDDEMEDNLLDELNSDSFEQAEDGTWELIEERVYLDDAETEYMSDVVITLNDDGYVDEMTFTLFSEGLNLDVEVDFSGYNSTTVELPE